MTRAPLFRFARPDLQREAGGQGMDENFVGEDLGDSPGEDRPSEQVLDVVEILFHEAALDFWGLRQRVKAGEFDRLKDTAGAVRDLKQAFILVLEERNRIDKLRKQVAGQVAGGVGGGGGGCVLDLDAARDEVGRRLARLRGAGAGG
jgi:hypothetical protein